MFNHFVEGQCVERCAAFAMGCSREAQHQRDKKRQHFVHFKVLVFTQFFVLSFMQFTNNAVSKHRYIQRTVNIQGSINYQMASGK
jgi:hypothetical protein